jgi:hypothetical protein
MVGMLLDPLVIRAGDATSFPCKAFLVGLISLFNLIEPALNAKENLEGAVIKDSSSASYMFVLFVSESESPAAPLCCTFSFPLPSMRSKQLGEFAGIPLYL